MFSSLAAKTAEPLPSVVRPPRVVPRSLFSRSLLIVILPLLILQGVLTYVFYERHWEKVTRTLAFGLAGEVALLVELLEAAHTPETRAKVLELAQDHFDFHLSLQPGADLADVATTGSRPFSARLDRQLHTRFNEALDRPFAIDTRWIDVKNEPSRIAVYVQLDDGVLRVLPLRKRVDSDTTRVFIGWMFGLSLLLLALAVYFMTRQVRPILRLAWAMEKFGKGRDVGDFRLAGPTEIRRAGAAFNLMRKRILRHISQRTEMLAAVSHDLRTPLTRMKLELEMLGEGKATPGDVDDLRADVEEMTRVIDGYLDFARGEGQEKIEAVELGPLLQEIADRTATPETRIEVELEQPITLSLRPVAMRRCLANLVENAARHGTRVHVRATASNGQVWVAIDDDGPGIPEDQREAAFKPFYRLDAARRPSTGGVGLGLTIARDIVLGHGGDIELTDAPAGGLRVLVRLPS
ncbi:MAG TPA: ATP-binding protein [Geminicoccaceae bacterium]|nr:ATP-binding protein [Geminicoccaceae bacterium]